MSTPLFSVIIPAYNQAQFLADAIQSVLNQTCQDFEVIVVNDASPDNTSDVVMGFQDPRIRYFIHEKNLGLPAARNSGMRASHGEFIALLDADDFFHVDKLAAHYAFFTNNPLIDVTYNARFDLHHTSNEIRTIYLPLQYVTIKDLVLRFQFTPSDMVLRRECLADVGVFDESLLCGGEDLDYPLRLALAGKKFSRVEKVLNYRRYHSGRRRRRLADRITDYTNALNHAFNDPRFPQEYISLHPKALANHYTEVASWALCQGEYELGNNILCEIQKLDPVALLARPAPFVVWLMRHALRDWNNDHETMLKEIFFNLYPEFHDLSDQLPWAITMGYLQRGMHEILWNRTDIGWASLEKAKRHLAKIEHRFLDQLVAQLILINSELDPGLAKDALARLEEPVRQLAGESSVHYLNGNYAFNRAFAMYRAHAYKEVPKELLKAAKYWPSYLANKGFYAVLLKSILSWLP